MNPKIAAGSPGRRWVWAFLAVVVVLPSPASAQNRIWRVSDPDSLLTMAREAAIAGRHNEAIQVYEQAATLAPNRRDEITAALAFQYAWAGDLDRASEAFAKARHGNPNDYDLRMGELLVTNWMGDHLRAWKGYQGVIRHFPDRAGPRVGLAAAQNWSGRRDLALATLLAARDLEQGNRDLENLDRVIRKQLHPHAGAFYDWSEDSDEYQVNGLWLEGGVSPHPQLRLVPFYNRVGIRQPAAPDIDENWVGVTIASRPSTRTGLWGRLALLTDPPEGTEYTPLTANITADLALNDRATVGAGYEHFAVVSFRTFPEKITGDVFALFSIFRPDWLTRIRLSADYGRYAPVAGFAENHRWNLHVAGSRQVWSPVRLRAGISGRYLDFDGFQNNGIWTPEDFWAMAGTMEWDWGQRDAWSVNGAVELGPARESGAETTLFASWRIGAYRAFRGLVFEAYVGHSEGNIETGTGYDRSFAHAGIRRQF